MTNPKISVVVPVYKVEAYIHQCVNSILRQTYRNLEVWLVDDGSPDNCPAICDDYACKDDRVRVIHKPNSGLSGARNAAMDQLTGDVIAFVDSDDWLELDAFEQLVGFMQEQDLDAVFMAANKVQDGRVKEVAFQFYPDRTVCEASEVAQKSLRDEIGGQVWLRICRSHCWEGLRFPEGRLYEDIPISFRPFLKASRRIGFLSAPLYNYRLNDSGISLSFNPLKAYHIFLGFLEHYNYAREYSLDDVEICLMKTVIPSMSVIHNSWVHEWKDKDVSVKQVKTFLRENKKAILKCSLFSKSRRRMIRLYYYAYPLYYVLGRVEQRRRRGEGNA